MEKAENHRRHFTPEQKIAILREHLVEGTPVSDVCDRHRINPNMLYRWQKELFENGAAAFTKQPRSHSVTKQQHAIEQLEHKLRLRDEALAELMQEHVAVKKSLGED